MKHISLLGSTGSIGTQTLDVIRRSKGQYKVIGLTTNENIDLLEQQAKEFHVLQVCVCDEKKAKELQQRDKHLKVFTGQEGLIPIACHKKTDLVVVAVEGKAGFLPTLHAITAGKDIALANKETLVIGGIKIMRLAKEKNVKIFPIDSEHSAIAQAMRSGRKNEIKKIWLTASGGPFRDAKKWPLEKLNKVTVEQALHHPTWNMGKKITIDSATLANKGLELIEAVRLFDLHPNQIEVVIHPQSIMHSAVEFKDGSIIGELGKTDMRRCISYALSGEERKDIHLQSLSLFDITLSFEKPDEKRFPCLSLAKYAVEKGEKYCEIFSNSNEEAVSDFLSHKIGFTDIPKKIKEKLNYGSGR